MSFADFITISTVHSLYMSSKLTALPGDMHIQRILSLSHVHQGWEIKEPIGLKFHDAKPPCAMSLLPSGKDKDCGLGCLWGSIVSTQAFLLSLVSVDC